MASDLHSGIGALNTTLLAKSPKPVSRTSFPVSREPTSVATSFRNVDRPWNSGPNTLLHRSSLRLFHSQRNSSHPHFPVRPGALEGIRVEVNGRPRDVARDQLVRAEPGARLHCTSGCELSRSHLFFRGPIVRHVKKQEDGHGRGDWDSAHEIAPPRAPKGTRRFGKDRCCHGLVGNLA